MRQSLAPSNHASNKCPSNDQMTAWRRAVGGLIERRRFHSRRLFAGIYSFPLDLKISSKVDDAEIYRLLPTAWQVARLHRCRESVDARWQTLVLHILALSSRLVRVPLGDAQVSFGSLLAVESAPLSPRFQIEVCTRLEYSANLVCLFSVRPLLLSLLLSRPCTLHRLPFTEPK